MIYYTSDLHFAHPKIIQYCDRPYVNIEEMNKKLVQNWNSVVQEDDQVYILGDLFMGRSHVDDVLSQLRGHKILIKGNHDSGWLHSEYYHYFEKIEDFLVIEDKLNGEKRSVALFHYPSELTNYSKEYISVYGHIHNKPIPKFMNLKKTYNAGVDVNNYIPVTLAQLIENNEKWAASFVLSPDTFSFLLKSLLKEKALQVGNFEVFQVGTEIRVASLNTKRYTVKHTFSNYNTLFYFLQDVGLLNNWAEEIFREVENHYQMSVNNFMKKRK